MKETLEVFILSKLVEKFIQEDQRQYFCEELFENIGFEIPRVGWRFLLTSKTLIQCINDAFTDEDKKDTGIDDLEQFLNCLNSDEIINVGK